VSQRVSPERQHTVVRRDIDGARMRNRAAHPGAHAGGERVVVGVAALEGRACLRGQSANAVGQVSRNRACRRAGFVDRVGRFVLQSRPAARAAVGVEQVHQSGAGP
jgi:hypothetical protein